jgi:hypothetical protein
MSTMIDTMRSVPRFFVRALAIAGLSFAAVAADAPAAVAQPNEGMEALAQMFDDPALANYRLNSATLTKFIAATQALQAIEDDDFDLEDQFDMENPESISLSNIAAAFDSEPRVKGAINGAGLSSREYVTFLFSMMQAMFASIAVQMGGEEALNDMPNGPLKDNVRFFMEHQEEFEALSDEG